MPLTSYCKKCGQDVPVSSFCPNCRSKLAANTVRLAWCVDHHPVRDWMCWNTVMRLLLPVLGATLLLVMLLEVIIGGPDGLAALLGGGILISLAGMMGMLLAVMLLIFILQGDDLLDCVVDTRGIHVQQYLPEPTALKLLLRGKSPRLMESLGGDNLLLIASREIAWKDVQRVQLWPEKTMILFYAPRWWMRVSLPCTPFTWEEALELIREKIGRKKAVILPEECRQAAPAKAKSARGSRTRQLSFDDVAEDILPSQPIPEEEVPPSVTQELEGDFTSIGHRRAQDPSIASLGDSKESQSLVGQSPTSLEDVLQEIKEAEQA